MRTELIILFIIYCSHAFASEELFKQANALYEEGDYVSSINHYKDILERGLESPEIYFNMGSCYFKIAEYKNSKDYYSRSLYLDPNIELTQSNINLCNKKLLINKKPTFLHIKWWNYIVNILSINNWIISSLIVIIMFSILLFMRLYLNKKIHMFILFLLMIINILLYSIIISKQHKIDMVFASEDILSIN